MAKNLDGTLDPVMKRPGGPGEPRRPGAPGSPWLQIEEVGKNSQETFFSYNLDLYLWS